MGIQIIKQPNGNYALFSTFNDSFIGIEHTPKEVIEYFVDEAKKDAEESTKRILNDLNNPSGPMLPRFTKSWEEALELHRQHSENSSETWNEVVEKYVLLIEKGINPLDKAAECGERNSQS